MEKIGNVVLDYTYYPGKDLYSDGEVEDLLLEIAENYQDQEFNQVVAQQKSWPVMYHFLNIRQNIVEWLPLDKGQRVLEIGAGCGAITGALADKAGEVVCVELSRKRSLINANRNKAHENIKIMVGNFQDIAENLEKKFDLITLIGVFEYSSGYITGDQPYVNMLKEIKEHLTADGKIVIAIENRLGLKYWAGCTEDHVGRYFEGLEGYPQTEGVRTFSKPELESIIQEAGGLRPEFYYPYPDYKFPTVIYSDDYLPGKGELVNNLCNFDRERLLLFDEAKVFDSLCESGLFPLYANSFLVILERD